MWIFDVRGIIYGDRLKKGLASLLIYYVNTLIGVGSSPCQDDLYVAILTKRYEPMNHTGDTLILRVQSVLAKME